MSEPLECLITEGLARRFWKKVGLPNEDGCMLWLSKRRARGYGVFWTGAGHTIASRFSLRLAEGEPPSRTMQAAHSCRNRDCVAPAHLRWATNSENQLDRTRDGTTNHPKVYKRKLTEADVLAIRSAKGRVASTKLAEQYGVSQTLISQVWRHVAWAHV